MTDGKAMLQNEIQQKPEVLQKPMDHGVLNLPLSRRGNIDAQIDAYKAQQAAEARRVQADGRKQMAADRKAAQALFQAHRDAILAKGMEKTGKSRAEVLEAVKLALWAQPGKMLAAMTREYAV